ncbi:insulinase family protein [Sphingomonas sp. BT553]|uniref:Insulinase family protein n=2 Tax=Sphingomonas mollis TaxID=2795726 RepID=A0ABS0XSI5_9SPHN|nr:insulinase family protein [Sphingomonas sp. BT553]
MAKPMVTPTAENPNTDTALASADIRRFIDQVNIPYDSFTLPNGLRVLVHHDSNTPMVLVSVSYDVGSKHEPAGRSGFAHLFEHLMFNGSENVPGDYLKPLTDVGGRVNGSTNSDRTNYYEYIPTQALDRALFMESDRMGHLLGALDQKTLDEQRGVVQNEKRNGSASPTSIVDTMTRAALYPPSHPYGHSVIGSMKDLDAADLDDVRSFFRAHYAPNNALLVLAGDVDLPTARRLVTKYFGAIPAGPRNIRPDVVPAPLKRTISETVTAPVTSPIIVREWSVPGVQDRDSFVLDAVMEVLNGGEDDLLTRHLVRDQKLFQTVSVDNSSNAQVGQFTITGTVRPGIDPAVAAAALDREIAAFLAGRPDADAVARFMARYTYGFARSLENVTSRGSTLADGMMTQGSPDAYKGNLRIYAAQTPASLMAVARKWLDRPRYELTVMPGPRVTPKEDEGIDGSAVTVPAVPAIAPEPPSQLAARRKPRPLPSVAAPSDPGFPAIERTRLSNGIPVLYARGSAVPFTKISMSFEGTQLDVPGDYSIRFMYALLDKGFAGQGEESINRRKELLGLNLGASIGLDQGSVVLDAPDVSLGDGLGMVRDMLISPDFSAAALERLKRESIDRLARARLSPSTLTTEAISPLVDAGSPYNWLLMYDTAADIGAVNQAGLRASFTRWIRPEYASIVVVSDKSLAELLPVLERTIGDWKVSGKTEPRAPVVHHPRPGVPGIVLIDLPGAVQADIVGRQTVPIGDSEPAPALILASKVLGNSFGSRINMNLREDKHWTYGSYASFDRRRYGSQYSFEGSVQQDKAGPVIAEVIRELKEVLDERPITADELAAAKAAALGGAASRFATRDGIVGALDDVRRNGRSDTYPAEANARYRAVTLEETNAALRAQLSADRWVWAIVGNAAIIRPQLDALKLPVRVMKAEDALPPL